jgi:hypothetical protein
MSRGADLNNPINLMEVPSISWQGEIKPTSDPEGRLCQFDTMINGVRAGAVDILTAYLQDERDTVQKIVTPFAPSNENDTSSYILFMAKWMGVGPADHMNMTNPNTLKRWISGQIQIEQGFQCATPQEISQGVQLALNYKHA